MKKLVFLAFAAFFTSISQGFISAQETSSVPEEQPKPSKTKYKHDSFLNLDYTAVSSSSLADGLLKLELYKNPGTFNIYCTPKDGFKSSLLTTYDFFASSGFLLKVDEKVYNLVDSKRVKKELRALVGGGEQLAYKVGKEALFVVDFSLIKSSADSLSDIVKIRLYTINLDTVPHLFDVKGIFDTVCGEGSSVHFMTEKRTKIRYETQFSGLQMKSERTVISSNGATSFQFVLDGNTVTPIEAVTFANIDELHRMDWYSGLRRGRGFSNIRGYDDSGLMLDWNEFRLQPYQKNEITFYVAVAGSVESPRGLLYVDGLPSAKENKVVEVEPKKTEPKDAKEEKTEKIEKPVTEAEVKKTEPEAKVEAPPVVPSEKKADVEFIVPTIKDYQLDPDYIKELIDKIDSLQSSKDIDKQEIMRLNAELDAILEKLGR